mgnify:FL=1|jgi:hypothetical protein|tara:strand:+ start:1382 stop:1579 length:198 start_codon:yes stop_codon:yes gene_type:complete
MIDEIKLFLQKTLTSRKFWAAVAASAPLAIDQSWREFAVIWIAYAGIQGAVDSCEALPSKREKEA